MLCQRESPSPFKMHTYFILGPKCNRVAGAFCQIPQTKSIFPQGQSSTKEGSRRAQCTNPTYSHTHCYLQDSVSKTTTKQSSDSMLTPKKKTKRLSVQGPHPQMVRKGINKAVKSPNLFPSSSPTTTTTTTTHNILLERATRAKYQESRPDL